MMRKILFSLMVGLFSVVTLSSGIYVMCNEISTSLSPVESSQEVLDENNDNNQKDEVPEENPDNPLENVDNTDNQSTDKGEPDVSSNVRHTDEMVVKGYYYVNQNIRMFNSGSYSYYNSSSEGTTAPIRYLSDVKVYFTYNGTSRYSYYGGSGNYTFTVSSVPSGYTFLGWFYYYNVGSSGSGSGWYSSDEDWEFNLLTTSTTWSGSSFGYDYSYGETDADDWEYEYLIPLVSKNGAYITDLRPYYVRYYYWGSDGDTSITQTCSWGARYSFYNYYNIAYAEELIDYGYQASNWVGWATSSTSTSYSYVGGNTFTNLTSPGATISLYAILRRSVSIIYDGNDATSGSVPSSSSATQYVNGYGSIENTSPGITVSSSSDLKKTGYKFSKWGTSPNGGSTYSPGASVYFWPSWDNTKKWTLYAQWTPITYTVRYYYWGSSGDTYISQSCTYDRTSSFYSASNFTFNSSCSANGWQTNWVGWATSASSTAVYYTGGANFSNLMTTDGAVVNLYAIMQRPVSVVYNGNGNTGGSTATSVYNYQYGNFYGTDYVSQASIEIAQNGFTKTGYNFVNWRTGASGGTVYNSGSKVSLWPNYSSNPTLNLYANWSLINHTVTIYPYVSNTNGLSYVRGVPGNYTVTASGGTGSSTSVSLTDLNTKSLTVNVLTGYNISVSNGLNVNEWQLMGIYPYATTPTKIQTSPSVTVSENENTNVYVYFAKSSANKLKYTSDNGGYFYFEDGVYPQSKVTGVTTSGAASGRTYIIAGKSCAGYIVSGQEYVCYDGTQNTVFKVEPIRWRVSNYGVSSTAYPSGFSRFGSFNSGFTAVSDKVLGVGSAMTKEQYNNATWNTWSLASSSLLNCVNNVKVNYAQNISQAYDKFGGVGSASVVSGTTSASGDVRVVSKNDLAKANFNNYDAEASDLVKYLLGCGTYAPYWTTNLGTQYGAGRVMTTGNQTKDKWLYENAGVRFAITFNQGVRQIGTSDTYKIVVKGLYNSAAIKVYNSNETVLKATYTSIVNNQITLSVDYNDVIEITNLTRSGYVNKGTIGGYDGQCLYVTGTSGQYYYYEGGQWKDNSTLGYPGAHSTYKFKNMHNNNGVVVMEAQWTKDNDASNYYDKLSFSYNHTAKTVSVLAANKNISGEIVIPEFVIHPESGEIYIINKVKGSGFRDCKNITSVILPNSIKEINSYAFYGCSNLKQIKLSNSLTKIDLSAFDYCSNLTSISLPKSITKVGSAFEGCTSLTATYYEGTLEQWASNITFSYDTPIRYSRNLYINGSLVKEVNLASSSITSIGAYAFYNLPLTSLSLPNKLKTVGEYAFAGCSQMTGTFPTSMTSVGKYAFYSCQLLKGTVGPLSSIGNYAFYDCKGLTDVTIASSLSSVGSYAFDECTNLRRTNYTGTVSQWSQIFFWSQRANPISYTHNLYINGALVTDLSISSVTYIQDHAFYNLTCAKSLSLSSSLKSIGAAAFKNCTKLTGTLTIPNTVTGIGESAFFGTGFTSVIIGSGITSISAKTFGNCYSLTSVKIGSAVKYIGLRAFAACNIKSIYIPSTVTTIDGGSGTTGAFYHCYGTSMKIYCGAGSKPSGYETYWDTYSYQGAYTDNYGYHPTINNKFANIYWGYTYSQYQSATGRI